MDLTEIGVTALVGGFSGALGAGVGLGLEKLGLRVGKYATYLGVALGVATVNTGYVQSLAAKITYSDARVEALLNKTAPDMWPYIRKEFPDDYKALLPKMGRVFRNASSTAEASRKAASMLAALRRKYAGFAAEADSAHLRALLTEQVKFYSGVLAEEGPTICAKIATQGSMALLGTTYTTRHASDIERTGLVTLKTIANGRKLQIHRAPATDADWRELAPLLAQNGATGETYKSLSRQSASDPGLCPALVILLKALQDDQGPKSDALRAAYAVDMAKG